MEQIHIVKSTLLRNTMAHLVSLFTNNIFGLIYGKQGLYMNTLQCKMINLTWDSKD